MKQTIEIKEIREKTGKNLKPYWVVVTQDGGVTCFDLEIIKGLKANIGKWAEVTIKESNGFKNLREFHKFTENETIPEEQVMTPNTNRENKLKGTVPATSFLVGYDEKLCLGLCDVERNLDITRNDAYYIDKMRLAIELNRMSLKHHLGGV